MLCPTTHTDPPPQNSSPPPPHTKYLCAARYCSGSLRLSLRCQHDTATAAACCRHCIVVPPSPQEPPPPPPHTHTHRCAARYCTASLRLSGSTGRSGWQPTAQNTKLKSFVTYKTQQKQRQQHNISSSISMSRASVTQFCNGYKPACAITHMRGRILQCSTYVLLVDRHVYSGPWRAV